MNLIHPSFSQPEPFCRKRPEPEPEPEPEPNPGPDLGICRVPKKQKHKHNPAGLNQPTQSAGSMQTNKYADLSAWKNTISKLQLNKTVVRHIPRRSLSGLGPVTGLVGQGRVDDINILNQQKLQAARIQKYQRAGVVLYIHSRIGNFNQLPFLVLLASLVQDERPRPGSWDERACLVGSDSEQHASWLDSPYQEFVEPRCQLWAS